MKLLQLSPSIAGLRHSSVACLMALIIIQCTGLAQNQDPYAVDPDKRLKSELPLATGLIVNVNVPLYGLLLGDVSSSIASEYKPPTGFEIHGYFDTWQLGWGRKEYGDMFMLTLRSVGRDVYSGTYIEHGSKEVKFTFTSNGGTAVESSFNRSITGLGFHYMKGYDSKVKLSMMGDMSLGISSLSGESSVNPGEKVSRDEFYYQVSAGIGARIPISMTALNLMGTAAFGLIPDDLGFSDTPLIRIALGLQASVALNLQID